MRNEDTHSWVDIDDGQLIRKCKCGTIQHDDGSVTSPDGVTRDGHYPRCTKRRAKKVRR